MNGEGTHVRVKIGTVDTHQTGPSSPTPSCGEMATPLPCSWTSSSDCETSYQIENTIKSAVFFSYLGISDHSNLGDGLDDPFERLLVRSLDPDLDLRGGVRDLNKELVRILAM